MSEGAGRGDAVLEREAGARRGLGAIAQHPPAAVRAASELEGAEVEEVAARRLEADHRPQEFWIAADQLGRQHAARHQVIVAVDVGDDLFEDLGALHEAARDQHPVGLVDDQRHVRQRPGALLAGGPVIFAVEHAGVAQILVGALETVAETLRAELVEAGEQLAPAGAHIARRVDHLIGNAVEQPVVGDQPMPGVRGRLTLRFPVHRGDSATGSPLNRKGISGRMVKNR